MHRGFLGWAFALVLAVSGCSSGGDRPELPTAPPTSASMVTAADGFDSPMDAVASPDGSMFYFTAHDTESGQAVIYEVRAEGGSPAPMAEGGPLEDPTGLVLSCDGQTLYVADMSYAAGSPDADKAPIYALELDGGALSALPASGVGEAASLAIGPECESLYVTGYTPAGAPALFKMPLSGGNAEVVKEGAPLESPSGVYVDEDYTAWVMDQLPRNGLGGALFAIDPEGNTEEVIGDLALSEPAGVSLVAGGGTAVIPVTGPDRQGQLITVHIDSGDTTVVETDMMQPAGIRTAREAGVFAVADADGDAIYRAQ